MPTSSELVKQKREREAWDVYMAGLRAAEAAKVPVTPPATELEPQPEQTPEEQASAAGRLLRSRRNG